MSEKIRELAEQAGPNTEEELNDDRTNIYVIDVEKFAELIVRECAEVADQERPNYLGCGYVTKTKGRLIREHFGVER